MGANVVIENDASAPKSFAYMMVSNKKGELFSTEHPLYQGEYAIQPNNEDHSKPTASLKPKGLLFSPLIFSSRKIRGVELNTRMHLSVGRPLKENLWMLPFVSDAKGDLAWTSTNDQILEHRRGVP